MPPPHRAHEWPGRDSTFSRAGDVACGGQVASTGAAGAARPPWRQIRSRSRPPAVGNAGSVGAGEAVVAHEIGTGVSSHPDRSGPQRQRCDARTASHAALSHPLSTLLGNSPVYTRCDMAKKTVPANHHRRVTSKQPTHRGLGKKPGPKPFRHAPTRGPPLVITRCEGSVVRVALAVTVRKRRWRTEGGCRDDLGGTILRLVVHRCRWAGHRPRTSGIGRCRPE